jgi:hypothetical protein
MGAKFLRENRVGNEVNVVNSTSASFGVRMTRLQNILISLGAFWLSEWLVVPFAWFFGKANNGIHYDAGSIMWAVALGVMNSLGRSLAAAFAGFVVARTATGPKPERWAMVVAILYVIDAPVRFHWRFPATAWDDAWQGISLVLPALTCLAAAYITSRFRRPS